MHNKTKQLCCLADPFGRLRKVSIELGDLEGARHAYRKSVELKPDFPGAVMNLGFVQQKLGNMREAKRLCPTPSVG